MGFEKKIADESFLKSGPSVKKQVFKHLKCLVIRKVNRKVETS